MIGIQPSTIQVTYNSLLGEPADTGDFTLTYDGFSMTIPNCHLISSILVGNSGGTVKRAMFYDERWEWRNRSIIGRYNIRLPNNFVDPGHEQSPEQLATLCFNALGVANFDVSALPDQPRPEIDWDSRNAAEALSELCDGLGCRIVPQRSTGNWVVCVTGVGGPLPDSWPITEIGDNLQSKLLPHFIKIVTAPIQFQFPVPLIPTGKDVSTNPNVNMSWQDTIDLTYCPAPGTPAADGFGIDITFQNLSATRIVQPDGTRISPREVARSYIFRTWRMADQILLPWNVIYTPDQGVEITSGLTTLDRDQVLLSDQLAQTYVDALGNQIPRPAFAFGQFWDRLHNNNPYPTRVDYQGQVFKAEPEAGISVSLSLDPLFPDRTILTFSTQMKLRVSTPRGGYYNYAQQMQYLCACTIRDSTTWQPYRYEYYLQVGDGTDKTNCMTVVKDDIQPWYVAILNRVGQTDNSSEVQDQCEYYANAIAATLEEIDAVTASPVGWFYCDLDGAISQVSYSSDSSGTSMKASLNTEHNFYIPQYSERLQQIGRINTGYKLQLLKYISDRQAKARGTWNT